MQGCKKTNNTQICDVAIIYLRRKKRTKYLHDFCKFIVRFEKRQM